MAKQKRKKKVAVVLCNGGNHAKNKIDKSTIQGDCISIKENYPEGILECASGCFGFGSCVTVCKFNAIEINNNGTAEVLSEKCIGCGLCVKTCPQDLIHLIPAELTIMPRCSNHQKAAESRAVCQVSCIACGICEKNCPVGAIHVIDNCAVIDNELCISCGMCAMKCPRGTILDSDGIFTVV